MKIKSLILCFHLLYMVALPTSNSMASSAFEKYKNDKIEMDYPATWSVMQKGNLLTFKNDKGADILFVKVLTTRFEEAAKAAGFVKTENIWRLLGRHDMEGDAEEISSNYWRGLIGEAPVGVSGDFGFGLGFATVAMISDGKTAAILSGEVMGSEEGDMIMKSVRLQKK